MSETKIQSPVAGTSPNAVDNNAATEGGVIPGAGAPIENIVLEQERTDGFSNSFALNFCNEVFGSEWKEVVGAYERYWIAYPQKMLNFSSPSFIPSQANVGGTNPLDVRRDPAGKLFAANRFIYPLWDDSNIKMSYRTYMEGQYVNVMLNNEAIDKIQAESEVKKDFEYAHANQVLFGSKMLNSDGVSSNYEGLKDLIANARGTGSPVDVDTINVLDTTNTNKYVQYVSRNGDANVSMSEAIMQLKQAIFKMQNLNSFFTYGSANGVRPLNESNQDIPRKYVALATNKTIEAISVYNYQIFKDFDKYFNVSTIKEVPYSIFSVAYDGNDTTAVVQMAGAVEVPKSIGLNDGEVFLFDADALIKRKYKINPTSKSFFTTNITNVVQHQEIFWSNYKINAPVMLFSFDTAMNFYGMSVRQFTPATPSKE